MSPQEVAELSHLFDEALELAPARRETWLDELGFARPAMTERLRAMLQGAATGAAPLPSLPKLEVDEEAVAATGERVGAYALIREIGRGGMGSVWLAERADGAFKRRVALKLPRITWAAGLGKRMAREREIGALLEHPNIARLYDAGVDEHERPYIAMEYVDGQPIDVYCRDHALDLRARLRLFLQVVHAVAHAHGRLVLHRDLKPGNVLVDSGGQAHLLDFGIAKLLDEAVAVGTQLTQEQGRALTLNYAAPEQITGRPLGVTADVYSLGVMLYELLSGTLPYAVKRSTRGAIEDAILAGDAPPPSSRADDPRTARALRGELDAIVQTALKGDPARRYQTADALADDIGRYLDSKPVRAQADGAAYRLRKFVVRNAPQVLAGCTVFVALAIGLGTALWQRNEALDQAERATALNTFVLSLIQRADPNASRQSRAADRAMLAAIEERIDAELKDRPEQRLLLQVAVADAYRNRGEMAAAQRLYARAAREAGPHVPEDHLPLLRARVQAANPRLIVSNASAADLDRAIGVLRRMGADGAELLVEALLFRDELGAIFSIPAPITLDKLGEQMQEARDVAERHLESGSRMHLKLLGRLAGTASVLGDDVEAQRLTEKQLQAARHRGGAALESAEYSDARSYQLRFRCGRGDTAARLELQRLANEMRARFGEHSLQYANAFIRVGDCADIRGDPVFGRLAEDFYAITAARETPPSISLMLIANDALRSAMLRGELDAAERYYRAAIENAQAIAEDDLRARLSRRVLGNRVCLLTLRGEVQEAERVAGTLAAEMDEAFARSRLMTPFDNPPWGCIVRLLLDSGRSEDALARAQVILDRCVEMKFRDPIRCAGWYAMVALAQLDVGQSEAARATLERSPGKRNENCRMCPFPLAVGRTALATGRPAEALEPLRQAYGDALAAGDTSSMLSNELLYWFGQAWIANGEAARGKRMVEQARRVLAASPLPRYRALAAR